MSKEALKELNGIIERRNFPFEVGVEDAVWGESDDGTEVYARLEIHQHLEGAYVESEYYMGGMELKDEEEEVWENTVVSIEVQQKGNTFKCQWDGCDYETLEGTWLNACGGS